MNQADSRARAAASRSMAANAASSASRLVHEELARRYDVLAGDAPEIVELSPAPNTKIVAKATASGTGIDHRNVRARTSISDPSAIADPPGF